METKHAKMFGCSTELLDLTLAKPSSSSELKMLLTSILSDAQEEIALEEPEFARKKINQVKYLIDKLELRKA